METMNIALPNSLKEYVQRRVDQGGYSSVSEYVRDLIRLDQHKTAKEFLEAEVLKGLSSGAPTPMSSSDWKQLGVDVRRQTSKRTKR